MKTAIALLLLCTTLAFAEQNASCEDQLLEAQWLIRQLKQSREVAESNVAVLGRQLVQDQQKLVEAQKKAEQKQDSKDKE